MMRQVPLIDTRSAYSSDTFASIQARADKTVGRLRWVQKNVRVYTTDFNRVVVKFQPTTETCLPPPFSLNSASRNREAELREKKTTKTSLFRLKLKHHAIEIGGISKATRSFNRTRLRNLKRLVYSAVSPRSPVRIRMTSSIGTTKILPSPNFPVLAVFVIASMTESSMPSGMMTSILIFGMNSI